MSKKLKTKLIGKKVFHYASVRSTMEVARKLVLEGAIEGTVVIADEQTGGRGRLGRLWLSPRGGLAMSIIVKPSLAILPQLIMLTSLAVVRSIEQLTGLKAAIKWPNDVLINNKKACGILIESEVKGELIEFAVVGIGINVNVDLLPFPEISTLATSLSQELGKEISSPEFVISLLMEIEKLYEQVKSGVSVFPEWRNRLETIGRNISVKIGEIAEEGKAESVAEDGSLFLRCSDGSLTKVTAGDITLLKD